MKYELCHLKAIGKYFVAISLLVALFLCFLLFFLEKQRSKMSTSKNSKVFLLFVPL